MEFCPTLDIIEDYFTKALQRSQFCQLGNIIFGIHEDDIPAYNTFGRSFLEEQKLTFKKENEEAQEDAKLEGD